MLFSLPRGGTLFLTRSAQDAFHTVVALVTGVFEQVLACILVRDGNRPLFRESRRIDDGDPIVDLPGADARETLDEMEILRRAPIEHLVGEVRRIDDERVAFPLGDRVPHPLSNRLI